MKKNEIEQYCTELVTPIIESNNFELVDVEYVKEGSEYYLRVYADKEEGINIEDCVLISRALNDKIDAEDKIDAAYILEVSSPGLTRPLKKEKDLQRSIGKLVDVKLYRAIDGMKEITGVLMDFSTETIKLNFEEKNAIENKFMTINRSDISVIKLAYVEE